MKHQVYKKEVTLKFKAIFLVLFFLSASFVLAYEEVKNLSLSAQGIEMLEIDCGAGFLKVYGREDLGNIEVEAEIILEGLSDEKAQRFIQEKINLSLERSGSRARLVSEMKRYSSFFSFRNKVINLTVNLPKNMNLDIDDGSGEMIVEDIVGNVYIEDGSGTMDVKNITGDLTIDDGSGYIKVLDVRGDVDIDDGSGNVNVEDVSGSLSIDDGSGTIYVRNVGENVILDDGSGSINVDGVEGNVVIEDDGSGSVNIKNVKGTVRK
jgi:DUF4097 and DUF4098 domain-containing protein YvlB